jgi:dTDP-4-amino-4,6-dideoxygalactose transaminase
VENRPAIEGGSPIRTKDKFVVFGAPAIGEGEIAAVVDCFRRRWIGTGPKVQQFEERFAAYKGSTEAVAVSSCTAALHLSMLALGIGPGDEVITTTMTFCSTVNSIVHAGATPVLVDCDLATMNITAEAIAERITPRTKAILVVHIAGRPCEMDDIIVLARCHNLLLIEDCAHAVETIYHDTPAGRFGDAGCFSFYATKNITTGEGGMVLTRQPAVSSRIKTLALHGMSRDAWARFSDEGYQHYEVGELGFKYNMMDIQAAIGLVQMNRIDNMLQRRAQIWARYNAAFEDLPCTLPVDPARNTQHAYHLYTSRLDLSHLAATRDQILAALTAENIGVGVHYLPVHQHAYYKRALRERVEGFPNADTIGASTLSLPLTGDLDDDAVNDVCSAFRRVLLYYNA